MKNYIIIICLVFFGNFCNACVCSETASREKTIQSTDVIIIGKVISKESFSKEDYKISGLRMNYVKYRVIVSQTLKGKVTSKILIIATTPGGAGDCGYNFQIGKTFLIYLDKRDDNKKDKFLYTSICTRTNIFQKREFDEVKKYCKHKGFC
jgi:hypothetical protein